MEKQRILLIDMDIISYRAAAVSEVRTIEVLHKASGKSKNFKTRTEFKKFLKDNNIEYSPEFYEIQDVQQAKPVSHALQIVKSQVNKLKSELEATDVYGFIGKGGTNFRLNLELPKLIEQRQKLALDLEKATEEANSKSKSSKSDQPSNKDATDALIRQYNLQQELTALDSEKLRTQIELAKSQSDYNRQLELTNQLTQNEEKHIS